MSNEGISATVKLDEKKLKEAYEGIKNIVSKQKFNQAIARGINKALRETTTKAAKRAGDDYIIKKADIKKSIKMKKQATASDMSATSESKTYSMALSKFKTKAPKSGGITAKVRKDGGGNISTAFEATMSSGHKGIFMRRSDNKIFELKGVPVPIMLKSEEAMKVFQEEGQERLDKAIDNAIRGLLHNQ